MNLLMWLKIGFRSSEKRNNKREYKETLTRVKGTRKFPSQIKRTMEQSILPCKHIKRGEVGLARIPEIIVTHGLLGILENLGVG